MELGVETIRALQLRTQTHRVAAHLRELLVNASIFELL